MERPWPVGGDRVDHKTARSSGVPGKASTAGKPAGKTKAYRAQPITNSTSQGILERFSNGKRQPGAK
jgi:hypothetical protein